MKSWSRVIYEIILYLATYVAPQIIIHFSQKNLSTHLQKSQLFLRNYQQCNQLWVDRRRKLVRVCRITSWLFAILWLPMTLDSLLRNIIERQSIHWSYFSDFTLLLAWSVTLVVPIIIIYMSTAYRQTVIDFHHSFIQRYFFRFRQ